MQNLGSLQSLGNWQNLRERLEQVQKRRAEGLVAAGEDRTQAAVGCGLDLLREEWTNNRGADFGTEGLDRDGDSAGLVVAAVSGDVDAECPFQRERAILGSQQ